MTTSRENGSLFTTITNKIATVEFGHPSSNSFPSILLDRLEKEINNLSENEAVNVILLKSEGEKAFCAGASFNELIEIEDLETGKEFFVQLPERLQMAQYQYSIQITLPQLHL